MEFENKIGLLEDSIDTLDDLFYVFDKNGNFLEWNKTVQEVTGYTEKEIRSMSPSDFFEGKDRLKTENINGICGIGRNLTERKKENKIYRKKQTN